MKNAINETTFNPGISSQWDNFRMVYFLNNPHRSPDTYLKFGMFNIPYIREHIGPDRRAVSYDKNKKECAINVIYFHGNSETIFCAATYMARILKVYLSEIQGANDLNIHIYLYIFEYPFYYSGNVRDYCKEVIEEWVYKVNSEFYLEISKTKVRIPESYVIAMGFSVGTGFTSKFMYHSREYVDIYYLVAPFSSSERMAQIHCDKFISLKILKNLLWKKDYNYFDVITAIRDNIPETFSVDNKKQPKLYILCSGKDKICGGCVNDFNTPSIESRVTVFMNMGLEHNEFFTGDAVFTIIHALKIYFFNKCQTQNKDNTKVPTHGEEQEDKKELGGIHER